MEQWIQNYAPVGDSILLSALVAAIPLALLFYLLAVRRTPGHIAALTGTLTSLVLAIFVWGIPVEKGVSATLMGAAFGLFPIVWIIITAVWIYNMTVESGEFEIIRNSLAGLTNDRRLQAIFIAFAFGSFIEGTAGFGTPVAITAAMLVGLGFNPLYAAGICLIANTAPVAFGAIGVPITTAASVSGLDVNHISSIVGRQLPFLSIIVPFWVCCTMCGVKKTLEVLPAILVSGLCFAASQFVFSNFHGPYLPDIMSAIVTIIGLFILLRFWKPKNEWHFPDEKVSLEIKKYSSSQVLRAWSSYIFLAIMVFIWGLETFKGLGFVKAATFVFEWPWLHNLVAKAAPIVKETTPYGAKYTLNLLASGGTAILIAGLIASFCMPKYGLGKAIACFARTIKQLRFPILTIATILGLAYIMNYSGMSSTLGLAFTETGWWFPLFAPLIGWLGVFLTGSDTSSNALFCGLQRSTAEALGLDPNLTVAANSSGGVTGKMISPQSISVATAATNLIGKEGNLFRFTLKHSIAMTVVVCIITLLQAYWLKGMLPPYTP
ncbi:MAG: lactate permease LctP family transporter [Prevotellaceae bacterium]|jgi:lactate permease|nr:lactate permease LctP family transporter [Prevotellaceae bacterium]